MSDRIDAFCECGNKLFDYDPKYNFSGSASCGKCGKSSLFFELKYEKRESEDKVAEILKIKDENKELKSLCLWAIRRTHKSHKEFAYNEYKKITGEEPERV